MHPAVRASRAEMARSASTALELTAESAQLAKRARTKKMVNAKRAIRAPRANSATDAGKIRRVSAKSAARARIKLVPDCGIQSALCAAPVLLAKSASTAAVRAVDRASLALAVVSKPSSGHGISLARDASLASLDTSARVAATVLQEGA